MKIVPDIKATFGETYFLGYTEKYKFDSTTNKRTDELESYLCKISSSTQEGQIEITVPPTTSVDKIKFNQKVFLQNVMLEPYAKSSTGTAFAQIILRCSAESILDEAQMKSSHTPKDSK